MESDMTKREKRLRDLQRKIAREERNRELGIKLLVKATLNLPALRKQEARLLTGWQRKPIHEQLAEIGAAVPEEEWKKHEDSKKSAEAEVTATASADDGLDIPAVLDRNRQLQSLPDPRTKEKNAERRAIEREKREAELRGKTRKMPLTGKAALDAIRDSH
jgi:hypothetical protein